MGRRAPQHKGYKKSGLEPAGYDSKPDVSWSLAANHTGHDTLDSEGFSSNNGRYEDY